MDSQYYDHYPGYFSSIDFDYINRETAPFLENFTLTIYGKEISVKRKRCLLLYENGEKSGYYYEQNKHYWDEIPVICDIKLKLERFIKKHRKIDINFDYAIIYYYENGDASMGYHNDSEALNTIICSVSFGASRKFRFRNFGEKNGYLQEFILSHGDLFIMNVGCQQKYKHSIPIEKRIKEPRINITFRCFDTETKSVF
jgi:alkylated DNA repair dioxygenase AlkB